MSRSYKEKNAEVRKEVDKVVTIPESHAWKLNELRDYYGWSARRAACFVLAYSHGIETVLKTSRYSTSKDGNSTLTKNLFLPMTADQANKANAMAKSMDYDFTNFFKMSLDSVYAEWKAGKIDFDKNELTKRFALK